MKNNIRAIRLQKNMTLEQVAERADTTFAQVQKLEKGDRRLTHEWMERIAAAIGCRPQDLITTVTKVPILGDVGAGGNVFPIDDLPLVPRQIDPGQQEYVNCEWVEVPPGVYPNGVVALRVTGKSMLPIIRPGAVIYYSDRYEGGAPDDCLSRLCVVQTREGRTMVKIVRRSHFQGKFDLQSTNHEIIADVELAWCAPVIFIKPA